MENLPRDLQLKIIQKFDMDTRIKLGMIRKLNLPQELKTQISKGFEARRSIPNVPYDIH